MDNRIVVWHFGSEEQPAYYAERDLTPAHLRIHAVNAPTGGDLEIDIRDDGVSIFANQASLISSVSQVYSEIQYGTHSATTITVGEKVTGGTSSATGIVVSNTLGTLRLTNERVSSFSVGETITGATSGGTAVIDGYARGGRLITFSQAAAKTVATLDKGENLNEMAEDFLASGAARLAGSIITCHLINTNGASNITVQLELESMDEEDEISE